MAVQGKVSCVILAGGEGKRLRPLSYYFQKCMIPIGNQQKPLLEYVIHLINYHGITDVTMLVGYKHEQIMNYFGDGSRFGVNLTYMLDNPSMKGTGAALINFYKKRSSNLGSSILIYYGDILSNINLTEMLAQHQKMKASATIALTQGYQVPVGVAEVKRNKIVGWVEKPSIDLYAGIGIMALDPQILKELPRLFEDKKELDITGDFLPFLVNNGKIVNPYFTDSFWYDVGSLEKYEKLENGRIEEYFSTLFSESSSTF